MESESNTSEIAATKLVDARLQAFAMCMICSTEYPADTKECPKCKVPLSLVRRCHSCSRVVSAKHRRCIHCGLSFFSEGQEQPTRADALERIAEFRKKRADAQHRTALRGLTFAVGIFLTVLFVALLVTHQFSENTEASPVATSYVLRPVDLRRAASNSSSNIGALRGGEVLDITGYMRGQGDQRWFAVKWKDRTAYLMAEALAPPKPRDGVRGFDLLKFYIAGIDDPSIIPEALKAVTYYVEAFPAQSISGQELRWVLAERARELAGHGKSTEELLATARAQYQILIDSNSEFAEKARKAMNAPLETGEHRRSQHEPEITVITGQADTRTITGFDRRPTHEVTLLEHAEIAVRLSRLATSKPGTIECSVAHSVVANGQVVIPAGAPCQVRIVSLQAKTTTVTVAAVTVRNHSYDLLTSTGDIRNEVGTGKTVQELSFQLRAPVAFTQ